MARYFSFRKWFSRQPKEAAPLLSKKPKRQFVRVCLEQLEDRLAPAAVTYSISTANIIEPGPGGTANMDFTVTRTGDLGSQLSVGYTTVSGTAQANVDFTPETGFATFAAGSSTATIQIPVFGPDAYNHPNLSFSVKLTGSESVVGGPVSFSGKTDFTVGTGPISIAVGDLNGDGLADLVIANSGDNTVSVLLNATPPGATTPAFSQKTFATGTNPSSVALADLNATASST